MKGQKVLDFNLATKGKKKKSWANFILSFLKKLTIKENGETNKILD